MAPIPRICDWCGQPFNQRSGRVRARNFCSRDCYKAEQATRVLMVPCAHCGTPMRTWKSQPRKYCSRACMAAAFLTVESRPCQYCGEAFTPEASNPGIYCSNSCRAKDKVGPAHPCWRGRPKLRFAGYRAIRIAGKYVDEHRYLTEQALGRKLGRNEVVHHLNGDKRDNRPENLVVMSRAEHMRLHSTEYWAKERARASDAPPPSTPATEL